MDLIVNTAKKEQLTVVSVKGEIDLYTVKTLKEQAGAAIEGTIVCKMILDLSGANYIDSTGLGILIGIKRRCAEKGGNMVIVSGSDRITNLFNITGLNKIFTIVKTIEEAEASF